MFEGMVLRGVGLRGLDPRGVDRGLEGRIGVVPAVVVLDDRHESLLWVEV